MVESYTNRALLIAEGADGAGGDVADEVTPAAASRPLRPMGLLFYPGDIDGVFIPG